MPGKPFLYLYFFLFLLTACEKKIPDPLLGRWKCVRAVQTYTYTSAKYAYLNSSTVTEYPIDRTYIIEFESRRHLRTFSNDNKLLNTKASVSTNSEGYEVGYGKTDRQGLQRSFSVRMVHDTLMIIGFFPFENTGFPELGGEVYKSYDYTNYFVKQ